MRTSKLLRFSLIVGILAAWLFLPLAGPFRIPFGKEYRIDDDDWAIFLSSSNYQEFAAVDITGKRQAALKVFKRYDRPSVLSNSDSALPKLLLLVVWPNVLVSPLTVYLAGIYSLGQPQYFHLAYAFWFSVINVIGWCVLIVALVRSVELISRIRRG